jgi:CDP-paratose 2-epimerase
MKVLITGGAGFIGCNAAKHYLRKGADVVVLDDLSRKGSAKNLEWLRTCGTPAFIRGDIADRAVVDSVIADHSDIDLVLHMAAQVAVTTSVENPAHDFSVNAVGSFNLLEAIRTRGINPVLIYASTNKVYGRMEEVPTVELDGRYCFRDLSEGVGEDRLLDFHSPYGCSKGAADQYVRDYARIFGLRTVVLRQSCIYGYRQFGVEDQGWVAWFTIASVLDKPITIYGDGKQIRDILFIDDLIRAFDMAASRIDVTSGKVYNIGGGPSHTLSLLELLAMLERLRGKKIEVGYEDWRPGDQPVYVSGIEAAARDFGWSPGIGEREGVERLYSWVVENRELFS